MIVYDRVSLTLRKKTRRTDVLENCSAVLPGDRRVGVLGHRTTGKSTVLQLALGGLEPNRGRMQRSGLLSYPVGSPKIFNQRLSLRENIVFVCRLYGFDPKPIVAFVDGRLNIGPRIDRPFSLLPREFKRPAMFLTSYAMPFDTYCVDEAPVVGNPGSQVRDMLEAIFWQRAETAGFLICSSAPKVIGRYCDLVYILKDRKLVEMPDLQTAIETLGPPPKRTVQVVEDDEPDPDQEDEEFII